LSAKIGTHGKWSAAAFVDFVDDLKGSAHRIVLLEDAWRIYRPKKPDHANWVVHRFKKDVARLIPEAPGVYAFLIRPGIPPKLESSVLIYIGKADRSIRSRYYRYLREAMTPVNGRPAITYWLRKYKDFVHFAYAEIQKPGRPRAVERRLLRALMPPANSQYPARLGKASRAFK
jgi:hypothetical protein